jgi:carotenoid cleavage dioxygenase-like enzyme
MQAFTRVDVQTGEKQTWFPGIRCFCEELVFVPGPKAATEETDGFLLGMVYDAAQHKSFLAVSSSVTCEQLVDLLAMYTREFVPCNHVRNYCWA